jgi:hypothetical protein
MPLATTHSDNTMAFKATDYFFSALLAVGPLMVFVMASHCSGYDAWFNARATAFHDDGLLQNCESLRTGKYVSCDLSHFDEASAGNMFVKYGYALSRTDTYMPSESKRFHFCSSSASLIVEHPKHGKNHIYFEKWQDPACTQTDALTSSAMARPER